MGPVPCYETRHARQTSLPTHRHLHAYAALVVDGSHVEAGIEGPHGCEPGTLILHPPFHVHGNRFGRTGARVVNLPWPALPPGRSRVLRVPHLGEALAVFRRAPERLPELVAECRDVAERGVALPDWQAALVAELVGGDEEIGTIARRLGVSPAHAARAVAASHGMSPQRLRAEARWQRALCLLADDAALAEVAARAGFADQSHLTRACRRATGLTPTSLRRHIKSVQDGSATGGVC
ncbi:MAG TPA: helix-turn-helix domain-containing protein [Lysobacter sp.]|nr:helix-turn-helix domain-containing protein [Lysobacter sp.]